MNNSDKDLISIVDYPIGDSTKLIWLVWALTDPGVEYTVKELAWIHQRSIRAMQAHMAALHEVGLVNRDRVPPNETKHGLEYRYAHVTPKWAKEIG